MRLAFIIAVRFLKSSKMQTFMIVLGIAVGVSVQVFIGSLISGLQKSLVEKTIGNSSQITLTSKDETLISDYNQIISIMNDSTQDIEVFAPNLDVRATAYLNEKNAQVILRGFDLNAANKIYKFSEKLVDDSRMPNNENEIILGIEIKNRLGLKKGDQVEVDIPIIGKKTVTVVGFFDFKVAIVNSSWGVSNLITIQQLINRDGKVSSVEMRLKPQSVFKAKEISTFVDEQLNNEYKLSNWISNNEELLSGLQGQSTSSLMIQVFVMISVVLGIASVLAIIVMQKSKQIGILKAMGILNYDASLIFLFEGLLLGFFGALLGVVLGLGLAYTFTAFAVKPDGSPVVPLLLDTQFIILSGVIAIVAATLASLIPARKSSKLSVIEVIRNG